MISNNFYSALAEKRISTAISYNQIIENSMHVIDGKCMYTYYRNMSRQFKKGIENIIMLVAVMELYSQFIESLPSICTVLPWSL
jgi:hypothetical protein